MTDMALPVLPADFAIDDPPDVTNHLAAAVSLADDVAIDYEEAAVQVARDMRFGGRFVVTDEGSAEWALRKIGEASIRVDEVTRLYHQFQNRLAAWFSEATKANRATIAFMTDHLEDYGRRHREEHPQMATIALPSGAVRTTRYEAKALIDDRDAVLAWAQENHPEIVQTEQPPPKVWVTADDVKKLVRPVVETDEDGTITGTKVVDRTSGELVPGMRVEPVSVTAKIVLEQP